MDPKAEGVVLYMGQAVAAILQVIMTEDEAVLDPATPVFGLSVSQIGRSVKAAAQEAGLCEGLHWSQRPRGHGPRIWQLWGPTGADHRRSVEKLQNADALHRASGGQTWRGAKCIARKYGRSPQLRLILEFLSKDRPGC